MIGVKNGTSLLGGGLHKLKREALFFDKICFVHGQGAIDVWRHGRYSYKRQYRDWADEMEYLLDTRHFSSMDTFCMPEQNDIPKAKLEKYGRLTHQFIAIRQSIDEMFHKQSGTILPISGEVDPKHFLQLHWSSAALLSRLAVEEIRILQARDAVSIDPLTNLLSPPTEQIAQGEVLELCIAKVPVPDETTPWKVIFDMKSDQELRSRARKLRLWTRHVADSGLNAQEAEEYILDLLNDYEKFMRLHRKKFSSGIISTMLVGSAEMLEDLFKLRFGKLAKRVVDINSKRNELLISEMEAPGREVSLVTYLNDSQLL